MMAQEDLVKEITEIAATMPLARKVQLYEFAVFLQSHPLPGEETFAEIIADEALWDAQFANTDDARISELVNMVNAEIQAGNTYPMFDDKGNFTERE